MSTSLKCCNVKNLINFGICTVNVKNVGNLAPKKTFAEFKQHNQHSIGTAGTKTEECT